MLALFVFGAGLRGTAWASVVKDVFVPGAVFLRHRDSRSLLRIAGAMFDHVLAHPQMLVPPPGGAFHRTFGIASTVLLTGLGFFMGPQRSMRSSARAAKIRSALLNAMLLPFDQCFLILMLFAGFSSALIVPGLKGTAVDQSFLLVVQHFYLLWILGLIAVGRAPSPP